MFANADWVRHRLLAAATARGQAIVLDAGSIPSVDVTAAEMLRQADEALPAWRRAGARRDVGRSATSSAAAARRPAARDRLPRACRTGSTRAERELWLGGGGPPTRRAGARDPPRSSRRPRVLGQSDDPDAQKAINQNGMWSKPPIAARLPAKIPEGIRTPPTATAHSRIRGAPVTQPQDFRLPRCSAGVSLKNPELSDRGDPPDDVEHAAHHQEHGRKRGVLPAPLGSFTGGSPS